jgi:orotidine-5'-phosphate decarboxylase
VLSRFRLRLRSGKVAFVERIFLACRTDSFAMASYASRLHRAVQCKKTAALVGLDPRFDQLPAPIIRSAEKREIRDRRSLMAAAYEEFCFRLIDVVAPLVPAVKPQSAFFEECGPEGVRTLARVIRRAREAGLIVICDAKRGDIGSTAEAYASAYLAGEETEAAPFSADALTVNPYLGRDTLDPFVRLARERRAGVYVLVRTSNPGAGAFQDRLSDSRPLYQHVASVVEELAQSTAGTEAYGCVGAVVGATYPRELSELRRAMPHAPLLVPGFGNQGGTAADVAGAFGEDGQGALVNNARGINFAHSREPYRSAFGDEKWEQAVEAATKEMIDELRRHTPAGKLGQDSPR